MYKLFARPGWGSVFVEAQLAWYGLDYEIEDVGDLFKSEADRARVAQHNPIAQLPTLILPDGRVMTESAAITLYLADVTGSDDFVPAATEPCRAAFLRWLIFIIANIYPTFTYADDPGRFVDDEAAQKAFRARVDQYQKQMWSIVEAEARQPWFLGERFSALDIYITGMNRWRPGQSWFAANAPKLTAIAASGAQLPKLKKVWLRNFPAT
jgi:GST-like protein